MGSGVGAGNLWPCQSLLRWEMRPWRQVRQGHAQPVKHAPLKFPDLAASYESVLSLQLHKADRDISFFGGGAYTHLDSWRELDDKIVTASANSWLASTKTENWKQGEDFKAKFRCLGNCSYLSFRQDSDEKIGTTLRSFSKGKLISLA